jgi:hypothetical protein
LWWAYTTGVANATESIAPESPSPGWVSVEERLPEIKSYAMVWIGGTVNEWIKHFYSSQGKWINMEGIVLPKYYEVTHWMPLPQPPKP